MVAFFVNFDFNDHINIVAKETFRRLGFVLQHSSDFQYIEVIKLIYSALVRSKLEASACVWHPHEDKYTLLLEKIQKAFLRYLPKRKFGYYPFMYPTDFLPCALWYNSLKVRRSHDQLTIMCKILRGKVDAANLRKQLCGLFVPDSYNWGTIHKLLYVPKCRIIAHAVTAILRSLASHNALVEAEPEYDLFDGKWQDILIESLGYCETTSREKT